MIVEKSQIVLRLAVAGFGGFAKQRRRLGPVPGDTLAEIIAIAEIAFRLEMSRRRRPLEPTDRDCKRARDALALIVEGSQVALRDVALLYLGS